LKTTAATQLYLQIILTAVLPYLENFLHFGKFWVQVGRFLSLWYGNNMYSPFWKILYLAIFLDFLSSKPKISKKFDFEKFFFTKLGKFDHDHLATL